MIHDVKNILASSFVLRSVWISQEIQLAGTDEAALLGAYKRLEAGLVVAPGSVQTWACPSYHPLIGGG